MHVANLTMIQKRMSRKLRTQQKMSKDDAKDDAEDNDDAAVTGKFKTLEVS